MMTAGLNWLTADDIRTKAFSSRRGNYPAEEVRAFLDHLAMLVDARSERTNQLEDQLAIAESDHRAAVELQRALAAARAETAALKDRVALAETVREDAVRQLTRLLDEAKLQRTKSEQSLDDQAENHDSGEDEHEIVSQAVAAAARTRADAHEQAQHIIDEAVRSAEKVRHEQQRWADEAKLALRTRLDELSAESDIQHADAREAATRIITTAADEAERIVEHAASEADRLVSEARAFSSAWFATSSEPRRDWEELGTSRRARYFDDTPSPEEPASAPKTGVTAAGVTAAGAGVTGSAASIDEGSPRPAEVNAETLLAKAAQLVSVAALMSPTADHHLFTDLLRSGRDESNRASRTTFRREAGEGDAASGPERV